ncbi:hypothetical protein A5701_10270 [Mycobacterium sp. E3305]|nr:hypothetical protein A5701_10270 [Mycobacterium sp. E3305]
MRLSKGVTVSMPIRCDVTVLAVRSMALTSPHSTRTFFCLRRISRVVGATSPSDRMPVATWYSNGWKRWVVVLEIRVTSTSARLSALAAFRPPNPLPMMTTR